MKWSIYVLKDPRTGLVRYVGWTTKTVDKRLKVHIWDAKGKAKTHRHRWILSVLAAGLQPEIVVVEIGEGSGWSEAEKRWITHYRRAGAALVNGTDGGQGLVGETPEARIARAKKIAQWWSNLPQEEIAARIQRAREGAEAAGGWSSINKANWKNGDPLRHQRTSEMRSALNAILTQEQKSEMATRMNAGMTFEKRSAARKKGWAKEPQEKRDRIKHESARWWATQPAGVGAEFAARAINARWAPLHAKLAAIAEMQYTLDFGG